MARLTLSLGGEGRGHATRALALIERLRERHRLLVYAGGDAWELLSRSLGGSRVDLREFHVPRFRYRRDGKLSYTATTAVASGYLRGLPALLARLRRELLDFGTDYAIADFEPALPRAAKRLGIPFASLSHQHLLLTADLSFLPAGLRRRAAAMGLFVRTYVHGQEATIVSSFYNPPTKLSARGSSVVPVGVLLRESVRSARPTRAEFLVAYFRRSVPPALLEALAKGEREVRVYGLGDQPDRGRLRFRAIDADRFVDDLAACEALVTTAGNQLLGEALSLGKPVLAMPEPGNYEQYVNAHLLQAGGGGEWCAPERIDQAAMRGFLSRLDLHRAAIPTAGIAGLDRTLEVIESRLSANSQAA